MCTSFWIPDSFMYSCFTLLTYMDKHTQAFKNHKALITERIKKIVCVIWNFVWHVEVRWFHLVQKIILMSLALFYWSHNARKNYCMKFTRLDLLSSEQRFSLKQNYLVQWSQSLRNKKWYFQGGLTHYYYIR